MADEKTGHLVKRPAVFLDRDGTICEEVGYLTDVDKLVLIDGAGDAVRRINEAGFLAVLISNQSGAARGLFPVSQVLKANERLAALLAGHGARLDAAYFCPHHPEGKVPELTGECNCRKPKIGMFTQAIEKWGIDPTKSYAIGDSYRDLYPPAYLGARTVLVKTGHGQSQLEEKKGEEWHPKLIADDLGDAVTWLIADSLLG